MSKSAKPTKHSSAPSSGPNPTPNFRLITQPITKLITQLDHRLKGNPLLQVVVICATFACMLTISTSAWAMVQFNAQNTTQSDKEQVNTINKKSRKQDTVIIAEPTVLPRRVDGTIVARADANTVPVCVMIENAAFDGVRPQSGISAASLVYEVIVEGGITRWMAVFAGESADPVGPVRSARDTYLEFASELNCAYVHAGGSYSAMFALQEFSMRDIDGLREPRWFWRDSAKYSPHNLFTKTDNLYEAVTIGHSWTDPSDFDMWNFVDDEVLTGLRKDSGETAEKENLSKENILEKNSAGANANEESINEINIEFGGSYNVRYIWNADQKYYERHNGGVPQIDANTGQVLTTRNIIIQHVPPGWLIEGKGRINFSVTGEGTVDIFRNGQYIQGTWRKPDRLSRTQYYDANDDLIPLARGTSWVEIVPEGIGTNWIYND